LAIGYTLAIDSTRTKRAREATPQRAGTQEFEMKFFIDTADLDEIRDLAQTGLVDGVTTNPSLIAKSGGNILDVIADICAVVPGPVSAEVTATDLETMLAEAAVLRDIAPNVAIKVPLTQDGLKACKALSDRGVMVNVTLCFSAAQSSLAAKAGASFVSPFVGRLDDVGSNGMDLISEIVEIYARYPDFATEVLVASVRHPIHVVEAARIGADVATLPPNVLRQLFAHPLTDKGLSAFLADWRKTGQSILEQAAARRKAAE
jgi:transaldolase